MKKILILTIIAVCFTSFAFDQEMDFLNSFISEGTLSRSGGINTEYYTRGVNRSQTYLHEKMYEYIQLYQKLEVAEYNSHLRGGVFGNEILEVKLQSNRALAEITSHINRAEHAITVGEFSKKYLSNGSLPAFYNILIHTLETLKNSAQKDGLPIYQNLISYFEELVQKTVEMNSNLEDEDFYKKYVLFSKLNSLYPGLPEIIEEEYADNYDVESANLELLEQPLAPPKRGETRALSTQIVYSRLISNKEFIDGEALTQREIQAFLESKNSGLKNKYNNSYPSQMIADVSKRVGINPKVMLVTLQKEKGLIGRSSISASTLDWAMGVGCYDNGKKNNAYRGFEKQIEHAALTFRHWYDDGISNNISEKGFRLRINYNTEWITVRNEATYSLYRYTPHSRDIKLKTTGGGNHLFCRVYFLYFDGFVVDSAVSASTGEVKQVNVSAANIRTGAGTNFSVLVSLPINTEVEVIEPAANGWLKIKIPSGQIGYVLGSLLK